MLADIQSIVSAYTEKTMYVKCTHPRGERHEAVETTDNVVEPAEDFGEAIARLPSRKAAADSYNLFNPEMVSSTRSDQDSRVAESGQACIRISDSTDRPGTPGFRISQEASPNVDKMVSVPRLGRQKKGTKKQSHLDAIDNLFDGVE